MSSPSKSIFAPVLIQKSNNNKKTVCLDKCITQIIKYFGCENNLDLLHVLNNIDQKQKPEFIQITINQLEDETDDSKHHYYFENNESNWETLCWIDGRMAKVDDHVKVFMESPKRTKNDGYVHILCQHSEIHHKVIGTIDTIKTKNEFSNHLKNFDSELEKVNGGDETSFSVEEFLLNIFALSMIETIETTAQN